LEGRERALDAAQHLVPWSVTMPIIATIWRRLRPARPGAVTCSAKRALSASRRVFCRGLANARMPDGRPGLKPA
jgi:hypothetical protein